MLYVRVGHEGHRSPTSDSKNDRRVHRLLCPQAQAILRRVRSTIAKATPDATETISYGIPAFKLRRIVVYFAAFKLHIGLYPPVKGDAALEKAVARYAGEKGNLRFAIERKIPYGLIVRIVKFKARQSR